MNRKGFTLVELLVTVAILGIVTGLSIPIVRNITQARINKKYDTYLDSLVYATKLYTDSYSDDLYGHKTSGCEYVTYDDLARYKLVKDIDLSGISCASPYTAVKIMKFKEKYYYKPYIGCGSDSGNTVHADIFKPQKMEVSEICSSDSFATIFFESTPSESIEIDKKRHYLQVKMIASAGVSTQTQNQIFYGFAYKDNGNNTINPMQKLDFNIYSEALQMKLIERADEQVFKAINRLETPDVTGEINLVLRVDVLESLDGNPWKTEGDNYIYLGPFTVDNSAPVFNDSKIVSTASGYNTRTPKLDFKITDVGYTERTADFKYCYSYDTAADCQTPNNATELKALIDANKWHTYNPHAVLNALSAKYDGKEHTIKVWISDAAGNWARKDFTYKVPNTYTLTFNPDGGSACNPTSIGQIEGKAWGTPVVNEEGLKVHTFCTTSKTGYNSGDWYTGKNGTGTKITTTSVATKNETVYPKWIPKTVAVTFDCNSGSGGGKQTFTYGVTGQKFSTTCTKAGYTLAGWKWSKTGTSTDYTVASGVTDAWINGHSPSATLYAHWTPKTVAVTFDCNGGTGGGVQNLTAGVSGNAFNKTCTREGYVLLGWKLNKSGTTNDYSVTNGVTDAWIGGHSPSVTIYAHWNPKTITITFDGNGATGGSTTAQTCTYGTSITLKNNGFTKTGHTFKAWDPKLTTCPSKNTTVKATWNANPITISYNGNGSTSGSTASHTCYYGQSCTLKTNGFAKTGHNFDGWYTAATGGTKQGASGTYTANQTFYAHWAAKKVAVTFNCNGGTGGGSQTFTYGVSGQTFSTTCSRTGYTLAGWKLTAAGTSTNYSVASGVSDGWIDSNAPSITIYAHWTANTYTVSYAGNGATGGSTAASTCTYGSAFTPRANGFVRSHYHFAGWSGSTTCTGNMIMTATWSPNVAIIRYHTGTGSGSKLKTAPAGWSIKNNYQIWNATTQDIHTVAYGSSDDPINHHGSYLYVKKTSSSNGTARSGKEWEKCDGSNCTNSTYNEDTNYTSEQYCNTTNGNCYCCIKVNWK